MNQRFDVVIVGAGMVGATLACALGDSRLSVALLDGRAPALPDDTAEYDLRVSAITLASQILFRNLGAWDGMHRRRVAPVEAMHIWEEPSPSFPLPQAGEGALTPCPLPLTARERGSWCESLLWSEPSAHSRDFVHSEIRFDAAEIGEACLAYIVENRVIQQSLIERLGAFTDVHALWPVEIDAITFGDDAAVVKLKDGRQLAAKILVGADGADSAVRRAARIDSRYLDMNQHGIVATVRTGRPHGNVARQHFLPTGPLALLPLPEPNACSIVWSADTARADTLMALDDAAFIAELQRAFGDRLGPVTSVGRRQAFPLALSHANRYTAPRLALVGDAAHTVHPLAGQGVNLGLLDVATLAETLLDAAARGRDIGAPALLRRYGRARKGDNLGMIATTGGFRYLFGNDRSTVRRLRQFGLGIVNRLTPIKRQIMRRAAGLAGERPTLARARYSVK